MWYAQQCRKSGFKLSSKTVLMQHHEKAGAHGNVAPARVAVQAQVDVVLQGQRQAVHEGRAGCDGVAVPCLTLVGLWHLDALQDGTQLPIRDCPILIRLLLRLAECDCQACEHADEMTLKQGNEQ